MIKPHFLRTFGIILIFAALIISSCNSDSTKQKELALKEKELALKEKELSLKEKELQVQSKNKMASDSQINKTLIITPQGPASARAGATFSRNGELMFYFNIQSKKGKIIINGKPYTLTHQGNGGANVYKYTGSKVVIITSKCIWDTTVGGDCGYGSFSTVTVTLGKSSAQLQNIKVQDCPVLDL
ncbi:MAG: hypothetical protein ACHQF4_05835 [Sphingobacteriales bacterium]